MFCSFTGCELENGTPPCNVVKGRRLSFVPKPASSPSETSVMHCIKVLRSTLHWITVVVSVRRSACASHNISVKYQTSNLWSPSFPPPAEGVQSTNPGSISFPIHDWPSHMPQTLIPDRFGYRKSGFNPCGPNCEQQNTAVVPVPSHKTDSGLEQVCWSGN